MLPYIYKNIMISASLAICSL